MASPCTNDPNEVISAVVGIRSAEEDFERELDDASSAATENADKFDAFVNGTDTQTVQLGGGSPTPTIRNTVRQMMSAAATLDNADVSGKSANANGAEIMRTLADRFSDIVNVKDFGAVGDGETDDTAAFQAAAAVSRTLFCPKGSYVVNGDVDATATGFEFFIAGTHNLHVRHLGIPQVPAASSAGDLLNQVQYTLGDELGSIRLLPTRLQPHGVLLKYGKGSGTNVRVEFDEPFPKTCLGVVGTISANPLNTTQISMFRTLAVDQAGFTAVANFYNPENGNYGTPAESYFWIAVGY